MELGNPSLKSFRQTYIRRVILDMARVYVHKEILSQTEELLSRALEHGVDLSDNGLPKNLVGYDAEGNESQRVGLYLELPTDRDLVDIEKGLGFVRKGNRFHFDVNYTVEELPTYDDVKSTRIGARQLQLGDEGMDAKFVNLFCGLDNPLTFNKFTKETADAVSFMQYKLGVPETEIMDWYTWQSILPKPNLRISGGHAGPRVRALQAAMRVFGYNPPLTSRYGTETIRAVRELQVDHNLRVTGRITYNEWLILFDYH